MFDLKMLQKMQNDLQEKFKRMQQEMDTRIVEGSAGGGMVTVKINGNYQVVEVRINEQAVDPDDIEMLQDLVLAATNNALEKVAALKEESVTQLTGGVRLPGFPFF
ncbi:MAG: YbaB/EbfC family nucleoid-associated protein [Candidatus Sumerlaeia bacterium]